MPQQRRDDPDAEFPQSDGPVGQDTLATPAGASGRTQGIDLAAGTRLAGYVIEEEIGRGGMGVVYRASEPALARTVALKLMLPSLSADLDFRARFESETRIAATLESKYVLPVYQAGEADEHLFMAMPYLPGGDLGVYMADGPMKSTEEVGLVLENLAKVLDDAHAAGLVHRDVKPGNVLLEFRDDTISQVYLADFGLSKAYSETEDFTLTGDMIGSPEYMSPEQIAGDPIGPPSDQYALACLVARMLYGFSPFKRENRASTLVAHLQEEPSWPLEKTRLSRAPVRRVLARALSKYPEKRFESCGEFAAALARGLPRDRTLTLLRPRVPVTVKEARKKRRVKMLLALVALSGILAVAVRITPVADLIFPPKEHQEKILYWDSETMKITSMDLDGKNKTSVTTKTTPISIQMEIAPDGSEFVWWDPKEPVLHVMPTTGGRETTLAGRFPKWTPDSKKLCYTSSGLGEVEPGEVTCEGMKGSLGTGRVIDFTPDGRRLLLQRGNKANARSVLVYPSKGTDHVSKVFRGKPEGVLLGGGSLLVSKGNAQGNIPQLCTITIRSGRNRCWIRGISPIIIDESRIVASSGRVADSGYQTFFLIAPRRIRKLTPFDVSMSGSIPIQSTDGYSFFVRHSGTHNEFRGRKFYSFSLCSIFTVNAINQCPWTGDLIASPSTNGQNKIVYEAPDVENHKLVSWVTVDDIIGSHGRRMAKGASPVIYTERG